MQKRVLIIHGWESNSQEHWFLEEKKILEEKGVYVEVPDMPNTLHPKLKEWVQVIEKFRPDKNSILIGHSLGGSTVLRFLEKTKQKIDTCILIATPVLPIGHKEPDEFRERGFEWNKIKKTANKFVVLNQTQDPWVPIKHGKLIAKELNTRLILVKGDNHFDTMDLNLINQHL